MKTLNNLITLYSQTKDEALLPLIEDLGKHLNTSLYLKLNEGRCTITIVKSRVNL